MTEKLKRLGQLLLLRGKKRLIHKRRRPVPLSDLQHLVRKALIILVREESEDLIIRKGGFDQHFALQAGTARAA